MSDFLLLMKKNAPQAGIERNPEYLGRIIRKGDLCCSILLTLQHDVSDGEVESETSSAQLCSANRLAIRKALDDLECEEYLLRQPAADVCNTRIVLADPIVPTVAAS